MHLASDPALPLHLPLIPMAPRFSAGPFIAHWRKAAGMSHNDLAAALGHPDTVVVRAVESGFAHVRDADVFQWADSLGVDRRTFALAMLRCAEPEMFAAIQGADPALSWHLDAWRASNGQGAAWRHATVGEA